jgi:TolA-binding protein
MKRTAGILVFVLALFSQAVLWTEDAPEKEGKPAGPNWYRPPAPFARTEYLILTGAGLADAWEPLLAWKRRCGLAADVVDVRDVLGNPLYRGSDGPETIRNFLRDLYWKWGLAWVLIGGDVNVVPTRFLDMIERQASDLYYACLDGTWNEDGDASFGSAYDEVNQRADLFLGRVPVENPGEVHAFLTKYFRYIRPRQRDYQTRILYIGAVLGDDYHWDADDHYRFIEEEFIRPAGFRSTHLEETDFLRGHFEFDPDAKPRQKCSAYIFGPGNGKQGDSLLDRVVQEVNRGHALVSHFDHSNQYLMGLARGGIRCADVKKFQNAHRPSVFFSSGCHVNQFDNESVSEELMLHPGGGAVAFIGCSVNSYAYQNLYERDFYEALFRLGEYRIARVFEASRERLVDTNAGKNPVTVLNRGLHLLGDPHMPLWTGTPKELTVSFAREGERTLGLRVSGPDGSPVSGATACLWVPGFHHVRGRTDAKGAIRLPLPRAGGTVRLTVSARNFIPHLGEIPLPADSLRILPFDVSFEAGDDAVVDGGESVRMFVALKNAGSGNAGSFKALLTTSDPKIEITAPTCAYAGAGEGEVVLPEVPLGFRVKGFPPGHHVTRFRLAVKAAEAVLWEGELPVAVHTPFLVLSSQRLLRAGKPAEPPITGEDEGRDTRLSLTLANLGSGTARKVRVELGAPAAEVTVRNPVLTLDQLPPGGKADLPAPFELDVKGGVDEESVEFILKITTSSGYAREEIFTVAEPPPAPEGLRAEAGASAVRLAWEPVEWPRFGGYLVFRADSADGPLRQVNLMALSSSCFEDREIVPTKTYHYRVCAVDRDLNPSPLSVAVPAASSFPPLGDWPKKTPSPVLHLNVCDVDGDGDLEVAAGDEKGGVWIWHHTGAELRHGGDNWTFGLFMDLPEGAHTPTFADLDGDGRMEVLTAGRRSDRKVYVFDLDGGNVAGWPKSAKGRLMTPPQPADLDGDGRPEVVFHEGFGKNLYVWRGDGTAYNVERKKAKPKPREIIGTTDPFTYFVSSIADLDGDGLQEIVGIGGRGSVYAFKPDGRSLDGFPKRFGAVLGSTAPVGDLDGDGRGEIVFVADGGTKLYALDGRGRVLPGFPVKVWDRPPAEGRSFPSLANLDGKPGLEIVLGGRGGALFALDGKGRNLPGFPRTLPAEATGTAVGDVDGDGAMEIISGCLDGRLYGFHHDGSPVRGFPVRAPAPVPGVPVLADIDGDGDVDLCAGCTDGHVCIWDLAGPYDPGRIEWATYGADAARGGAYRPAPAPPGRVRVLGTDKARVMWQAPRKTRVLGYHVYRGGTRLVRITRRLSKKVNFVDADVVPGKRYTYAVTAVAPGGRESRLSGTAGWGDEAVKALFARAQKLEKGKNFPGAIKALGEILAKYPASDLAAAAKKNLERLRSDTGVQADLAAARRASWCRGMLSLARTWAGAGKKARAADALRKIIEKYPDSRWAEEARGELAKIGKD